MSAQVSIAVEFTAIHCGECGGSYAINERYREQQYKKGGTWTCPYCKTGWGYAGNSENAVLKKQLDEERERKLRALEEANQLRASMAAAGKVHAQTAGKLKALKKRAKHGVCPCCTRTFTNVARHMQTKHPEFKP